MAKVAVAEGEQALVSKKLKVVVPHKRLLVYVRPLLLGSNVP